MHVAGSRTRGPREACDLAVLLTSGRACLTAYATDVLCLALWPAVSDTRQSASNGLWLCKVCVYVDPRDVRVLRNEDTVLHEDTALALGGSMAHADVLQMFRGQKASTHALLRHSGLMQAA